MYGKCIVADYNSVHKDKCAKEFLKLKECYLVGAAYARVPEHTPRLSFHFTCTDSGRSSLGCPPATRLILSHSSPAIHDRRS